jgi:hypothetical protein
MEWVGEPVTIFRAAVFAPFVIIQNVVISDLLQANTL